MMHCALYLSVLSLLLPVALAAPSPRGTGKRGLAWTWFNNLDPGKFSAGKVAHIYNYETYKPSSGTGGLDFIGMQGCYPTCNSSPIGELKNRAAAQGWTTVFSANEPDIQGKTPGELAQWYKTNINPLAIHKAVPSVSSSTDAGKGLDWLQQFLNACAGGCYHDFINLHWYGPNFDTFKNHINNAHAKFPNEKIVVTEYALTAPATADQQNAFFKQATTFLDGLSYVEMHFPFVATSPALLKANDGNAVAHVGTGSCLYTDAGGLSAVGQTVANN